MFPIIPIINNILEGEAIGGSSARPDRQRQRKGSARENNRRRPQHLAGEHVVAQVVLLVLRLFRVVGRGPRRGTAFGRARSEVLVHVHGLEIGLINARGIIPRERHGTDAGPRKRQIIAIGVQIQMRRVQRPRTRESGRRASLRRFVPSIASEILNSTFSS